MPPKKRSKKSLKNSSASNAALTNNLVSNKQIYSDSFNNNLSIDMFIIAPNIHTNKPITRQDCLNLLDTMPKHYVGFFVFFTSTSRNNQYINSIKCICYRDINKNGEVSEFTLFDSFNLENLKKYIMGTIENNDKNEKNFPMLDENRQMKKDSIIKIHVGQNKLESLAACLKNKQYKLTNTLLPVNATSHGEHGLTDFCHQLFYQLLPPQGQRVPADFTYTSSYALWLVNNFELALKLTFSYYSTNWNRYDSSKICLKIPFLNADYPVIDGLLTADGRAASPTWDDYLTNIYNCMRQYGFERKLNLEEVRTQSMSNKDNNSKLQIETKNEPIKEELFKLLLMAIAKRHQALYILQKIEESPQTIVSVGDKEQEFFENQIICQYEKIRDMEENSRLFLKYKFSDFLIFQTPDAALPIKKSKIFLDFLIHYQILVSAIHEKITSGSSNLQPAENKEEIASTAHLIYSKQNYLTTLIQGWRDTKIADTSGTLLNQLLNHWQKLLRYYAQCLNSNAANAFTGQITESVYETLELLATHDKPDDILTVLMPNFLTLENQEKILDLICYLIASLCPEEATAEQEVLPTTKAFTM